MTDQPKSLEQRAREWRPLARKLYDKVMELENGEGGCSLYDYTIDIESESGFDESRIDHLLWPIQEMLAKAMADVQKEAFEMTKARFDEGGTSHFVYNWLREKIDDLQRPADAPAPPPAEPKGGRE